MSAPFHQGQSQDAAIPLPGQEQLGGHVRGVIGEVMMFPHEQIGQIWDRLGGEGESAVLPGEQMPAVCLPVGVLQKHPQDLHRAVRETGHLRLGGELPRGQGGRVVLRQPSLFRQTAVFHLQNDVLGRIMVRVGEGRLEQEGLVIFGAQIGRREDLPGEGKIRVVIGPGELFPGAQPHLHGGGGVPPDENGGPVVDAPHAIQIQPMEGEDQAWGLSLDWSRGRLPPTGRKRSAGEKEGQDQGSRPPGRAGTGRGERFRQSAHGRYLFSNFLMSKAGPQKRPSDWEGTRTSSPRLL